MQFQSLCLDWGQGKLRVYMHIAHRTLYLFQSSSSRQLDYEFGGPRMTGHTLEERFKAAEGKLKIRIAADSEAKEENAGYQGGDCNGVLATDVFDVDGVGGNE